MKPRTAPEETSGLLMGPEQELSPASYMMTKTTTTTTTTVVVVVVVMMTMMMTTTTNCFAKQNDHKMSTASYIMSLGYG
jgi:hypothetical protein